MRIGVADQNLVVLYGVSDSFGTAQLGQYGLEYAAVAALGPGYERHEHDKFGRVLGPDTPFRNKTDRTIRMKYVIYLIPRICPRIQNCVRSYGDKMCIQLPKSTMILEDHIFQITDFSFNGFCYCPVNICCRFMPLYFLKEIFMIRYQLVDKFQYLRFLPQGRVPGQETYLDDLK